MMKSSDGVNTSQTLDPSARTYADGFNQSPGPMAASEFNGYKSQYPSLPAMSPHKMHGRSGSMDHISAEMTQASNDGGNVSRSPSKLAQLSAT